MLDRHDSLVLLSIYITSSDVLNDISLASDVLVRKKIYQRLKPIDGRYLNPINTDAYVLICNSNDPDDTLIDKVKNLIHCELEESIKDDENDDTVNMTKKPFSVQQTFGILYGDFIVKYTN